MQYPKKSHRSPFVLPELSNELAEFCGILLGDGGIYTYQTKITLHADEEKEYGMYIHALIQELFGITAVVQHKKNARAIDIVISRIGITEFLTKTCEFSGNKSFCYIDIPQWIQDNPLFLRSCIRGLVDTDGSIFTHRYQSKGKEYSYKKISFTSTSTVLLNSVQKAFLEQGLHARIGSNHDVRIDSISDVASYFNIYGSKNPKHLKRLAT